MREGLKVLNMSWDKEYNTKEIIAYRDGQIYTWIYQDNDLISFSGDCTLFELMQMNELINRRK